MTSVSVTDHTRKGNALCGIILFLFISAAVFFTLFFLYSGHPENTVCFLLYYLSGIAALCLIFFLAAPLFRPLSFLLPDHPVRPVLSGVAFAFLCMLILFCIPWKGGPDIEQTAEQTGKNGDIQKLMLIAAAEDCSDTFLIIAEDDIQSFRQYYRYTLEYYEKSRHAGVTGVLLPETMKDTDKAAVLTALKQTFRKVYVIQLETGTACIASDDPRLTDDWNELEKRAQRTGAYAYAKMPGGMELLRVVFPLYQNQEKTDALQKLSDKTEPFSIKNITIRQFPFEYTFFQLQKHFVRIFLLFIFLYGMLRYWQGGPDQKKQKFRLFEFGFFYTGIVMTVFLKFHPSVYSGECFLPRLFYGFSFLFFAVAALFRPRKEYLLGYIFILITLFFTLFTMQYTIFRYLLFLIIIAASHVQSHLSYAVQAAPGKPLQARYIFLGMAVSIVFSAIAMEAGNIGFWTWGAALMLLPFLRKWKRTA